VAGHCHCGAIRVEFEPGKPVADLPVRACQCGFCRRKDAKTVSDPEGHLHVTAAPGAIRRYRFGRNTADFLLCAECGEYVAAVMQEGEHWFGVVNVRGTQMHPFADRKADPVVYDDEDAGDRVARRAAKWTPATIVEASPNA
jgi:hypothetical protein